MTRPSVSGEPPPQSPGSFRTGHYCWICLTIPHPYVSWFDVAIRVQLIYLLPMAGSGASCQSNLSTMLAGDRVSCVGASHAN